MKPIKVGTRGSKLALWQAYYVEDLLRKKGLTTQIVIIETKGDKIQDRSLSKIGSKGVFTEELEEQLRDGRIDIAVHSAKDMQATLPEGFEIMAFTEREQAFDVVVSQEKGFSLEKEGAVVGTSSVRRTAFLRHFYPHVKIVDMRGNLQTRMQKHERGDCEALLLAYAGVHRMEYHDRIVAELPSEKFVPPVGQGTVAIECCPATLDREAYDLIREATNHKETELCLLAERAYLKTLKGGCSIPAFGHATLKGETITLTAGLISTDGKQLISYTESVNQEEGTKAGDAIARKVLENGGKEILAAIRQHSEN